MAQMFQPNSTGSSSASGGGGSKNYLAAVTTTGGINPGNGDFELNATTGFSLAHSSLTNNFPSTVATATNSFSSAGGAHGGSAASGNLSQSIVSSGQLAGSYSYSYASSAATTAGDMVITDAFNIDTEDQAKVLTFKIYYKAQSNGSNANWSGTSSNSFGIAVYDVTNATWIMPAGVWGMTQSTGVGYVTGTFQTTSNSKQYQLAMFNANATSGAITLYLDDWSVGPQTAPVGPAESNWIAYTPTILGAGTPTSISFYSRRIGSDLEVRGTFVTGTVSATTASVSLGYNGVNANVTTSSALATNQVVGEQVYLTNGAVTGTVLVSPSSGVVNFSYNGATSGGSGTPQLGNAQWANSMTVISCFRVPITGWDSNTTMSSDTDTRVVAFRTTGTCSGTLNSSFNTVTWPASTTDTHASFNGTTTYTIPVTGFYDMTAQIAVDGTYSLNSNSQIQFLKNGSAFHTRAEISGGAVNATNLYVHVDCVACNAGDAITVQVKTPATSPTFDVSAGYSFWTISRRSGPAVVQAVESVNARYFASATAISGSLATIVWTTKDFDTHNGMSSGVYTIPVAGKYQINMGVALAAASAAAGNAVDVQIQKNGTAVTEIAPVYQSTQTPLPVVLDDIISCVAGDLIKVQVSSAATTPSIAASNSKNFFSIARVGN